MLDIIWVQPIEKKKETSLVVQWLRNCLPIQGTPTTHWVLGLRLLNERRTTG